MRKKAMRKEFWMEIRNSYPRFISIFLIVLLGVAFFAGLRSSKPDMELSADRLYDDGNYMDIKVLGTLGLNEGDVEAISAVPGVENAEGAYSADVLYQSEDKQFVLKFMSQPLSINMLTVKEGRLPENNKECIADEAFLAASGRNTGDTIKITSGDGNELSNTFAQNTYTIVGSATTPHFLSRSKGNSNIGKGSVDYFIMVPADAFSLDCFTEIYATVDGARELLCYSDAYSDLAEASIDRIKDTVLPDREQSRYNEIRSDADAELEKAKTELADGETEADHKLADAAADLREARKKIDDGQKEIDENEKILADGEAELKDGEKKLAEGGNKLNASEQQLKKSEKELKDGTKQYNDGKAEYDKQKKVYDTGAAELKAAAKQLDDTEAKLAASQLQITEGKAGIEQQAAAGLITAEEEARLLLGLDAKQTELAAGFAQLAAGRQEYEKSKAKLGAAAKELDAAEKKLNNSYKKLSTGKAELNQGKSALSEAKAELKKNEKELLEAKKKTEDGRKKLEEAKRTLEDGRKELADGNEKYEQAKADADKEISDGKEKIADAEKEINDIKPAKWYILGRDSIQTYMEYAQDAERIGAIGDIFPLIFFLVAALVCLTTMTRMVEEERTQIGTMKALGYGKWSIAMKYIKYAFLATLSGSIVGGLIGCKLLPAIVLGAYRIIYEHMHVTLLPFNLYYIAMAAALATGCVLIATAAACIKELMASPADLMRPAAPKHGKRVFLERLPFIWKHLNFTKKATVRNLFRYKKRFYMTIIGIGGSMALLLVGFGIKDSIFSVVALQYDEIEVYDASLELEEDKLPDNQEQIEAALREEPAIAGYKYQSRSAVDAIYGKNKTGVFQKVLDDKENLDQYFHFRDRISKKTFSLTDQGVIVTEKMAKTLGIKKGDTITLEDSDNRQVKAPVEAVMENYVYNYVFMTAALYEKLYGEPVQFNEIILDENPEAEESEEELSNNLLAVKGVTGITLNDSMKTWFSDIIGSLNIVVLVLIISAGGLAFVVLYNLNNISINERKRELATIKVLGFYDLEVSEYIYRENIILTILGIILGIFLGTLLHRYVIVTCEINMIMFGRNIFFKSHVYSALITCLFALLINVSMHFKLKKVDMAASLKSVE